MDKEIYTCRAPFEATRKEAAASIALFILLCAVLMVLLGRAPFAGVWQLLILAAFALLIYSVMKRSLFDITYVLYEDRLEFKRRYGTITMENEVFPLAEARFEADRVIYRGKTYPFHPDERLKEKLGISK